MTPKQQLQQLNNRLDKCRHSLTAAQQRKDPLVVAQYNEEIASISLKISDLKDRQSQQLSTKALAVKAMAFHRPLSKAEQADQGKLKKSVRGLVVVHPMAALGRELGLQAVTGYAPVEF